MEIATELLWYVEQGLVRTQQHPTLPLTIYNYAERVQYDKLWDEVLLQCRGLVMHGDTVVARPFRKFFNDHELRQDEIPWHLPCEITEKMDGSLLIVFWFQDQWVFATRGSFTSEQAQRGREIFAAQHNFCNLLKGYTYLFEVIYPENRIVLDYGDDERVVLLAVVDTKSGEEIDAANVFEGDSFNWVQSLPPDASPRDLKKIIRDDQEGYVVRFSNGYRMKVKGEKYFELHRIYSGISSRMVWEYYSQRKPLDEILDVLPDEFAQWVKDEYYAMGQEGQRLKMRMLQGFCDVIRMPTRKEQALFIKANYSDVSAGIFAMLDGKDVDQMIFKMQYPEMRRPAGSLAGVEQ